MRPAGYIMVLVLLGSASLNCGDVICDEPATHADSGADDVLIDDAMPDMTDVTVTDVKDVSVDAPIACPARVPTGTQSTAYRVDATHVGVQPTDTIALPLCRRWQRDFSASNATPLVVAGRVLALDRGDLYALDMDTGETIWGPAPLRGNQLASDGTSVYVESAAGYVAALDVQFGQLLWEAPTLTGQFTGESPTGLLTVSNGRVVISTSVGAYALDATTGAMAWVSPTSPYCGPGATLGGVAYVPCDCAANTAISVATGSILWQHAPVSKCNGPSFDEPMAATPSGLYAPGLTALLAIDPNDGTTNVYPAQAWLGPAITSTAIFIGTGVDFEAWSSDLAQQLWAFTGDGQPNAAPLVVGPYVVEATWHTLYILDATTGTLVAKAKLSSATSYRSSLVEADGLLLVATEGGLFAY